MTLVQVLADETSVHMACDFLLTDPDTREPRQHDAHKLVTVTTPSVSALIGVTGIATVDRKPVGQWIAEATTGLGSNASVEDVFDALQQAATPLSVVTNPHHRRTTFVVASMIGSQSLVTLVSNFETFVKGQIKSAAVADRGLHNT